MIRIIFIGLFIICTVALGRAVEKFIWNGVEFTPAIRSAIKTILMNKYKKPDGDKKIEQKDNCKPNGDSCWEEKPTE